MKKESPRAKKGMTEPDVCIGSDEASWKKKSGTRSERRARDQEINGSEQKTEEDEPQKMRESKETTIIKARI
jgi:hypothetical protein